MVNIAEKPLESNRDSEVDDIVALHQRCGIYTKPEVVERILDAVGWRAESDLSQSRLLEPAAGDGAFIVEAGVRLIRSYRRLGIALTAKVLKNRILGFELHGGEVAKARERVERVLCEVGVHHRTASACAKAWIVEADFLLADLTVEAFTHVVGNPPYIRWSKIPPTLKSAYDRHLPGDIVGGDLFLPFLHRSLELLLPGGRCGMLCSDRWRYMAFAENFRNNWLPRIDVCSDDVLAARDAFVRDVDAYPSVLIARKRAGIKKASPGVVSGDGKTLIELGCTIRVGPALGHTPAFVLEPGERDVEPDLLRPWIDAREIAEGKITWRGRRVVTMHDAGGKLIDLDRFPRLADRLERHRDALSRRSIVRKGAAWFRTIDRVRESDWTRPKLLVPELAKTPRIAVDRSGAVPSHGVYAIFAPDDDIDALYDTLKDGQLASALKGIAPRVKGQYVRCYRRFLAMVRPIF